MDNSFHRSEAFSMLASALVTLLFKVSFLLSLGTVSLGAIVTDACTVLAGKLSSGHYSGEIS